MYHVSNDKRTKTSAEMIYNALILCMKEKSFSKISITDIQKISGVARTTFYRDFDHMIDVLHWKCNLEYKRAMETYINMKFHNKNENEFLIFFFSYWMNQYEILDAIISIGRYDIIYLCHSANSYILTDYFSTDNEILPDYYNYFMAMRIGIFIGVLVEWVTSGRNENAERLVSIIIEKVEEAAAHKMIF